MKSFPYSYICQWHSSVSSSNFLSPLGIPECFNDLVLVSFPSGTLWNPFMSLSFLTFKYLFETILERLWILRKQLIN